MGRIAGIRIQIHATFLILLVWVALQGYQAGGSARAAALGVLFILAIFASVVLHELGHALAARRYGVPTRDITLLPIGGVARLERMPEQPRQELVIALAGPAVTAAIAVAIYAVLAAIDATSAAPIDVRRPGTAFLAQLMWSNIWILGFNMLPAFPMDGGRVLRALIAMRTGDYVRATELAAGVGKVFAVLFAVAGLFWFEQPLLVFIALFVWLGAAGEAATAQFRGAVDGVPVAHAMIRDVRTIGPGDTLDVAARHILDGFQQDFPVVDGSRVVGVLTRKQLMKALAENGLHAPVGSVMERTFQTAQPTEPLANAFARLQSCNCHTIPVVSDGRLVGVLTADSVGEYLMIDSALRANRA
jgi:Zn-dependent protease/CBS domain-containing protein